MAKTQTKLLTAFTVFGEPVCSLSHKKDGSYSGKIGKVWIQWLSNGQRSSTHTDPQDLDLQTIKSNK